MIPDKQDWLFIITAAIGVSLIIGAVSWVDDLNTEIEKLRQEQQETREAIEEYQQLIDEVDSLLEQYEELHDTYEEFLDLLSVDTWEATAYAPLDPRAVEGM